MQESIKFFTGRTVSMKYCLGFNFKFCDSKMISMKISKLSTAIAVFAILSDFAQAQLTWTTRALPRDGQLGAVAFGAGRFAAPTGGYETEGNFVATSTDGASWQLAPIPMGADSIASSGTNFVIAGYWGKLMSSPNGTLWSPIALPYGASELDFNGDISFSAGRYYITSRRYLGPPTYSTQKVLLYAPANLSGWTLQIMNLPKFPYCVAYGASRFVASVQEGSDYWIYSSTDGATWTKASNLGATQPRNIRFLNNRFIAVGEGGSIWVSADGLAWLKKSTPTSVRLVDAAFGRGIYVVLGEVGQILISTDSNTWTSSPFGGHWSLLRSVAFGGRFLVTGPKEAVLRSN